MTCGDLSFCGEALDRNGAPFPWPSCFLADVGFAMHRLGTFACAVIPLALLIGCGGGSEMVPIRGEVTFKGQPLARGIVNYLPAEPNKGRTASGPLQADGTFVMTTMKAGDGVMPGVYDIIIHSYEENPDAPKTREEIEAAGSSGQTPLIKSIIPDKYASAETSGLNDTVDDNHSGFKKIELSE